MPLVLIAFLFGLTLYAVLFARSVFIIAYHGVGREPSPLPGLVISPEAFRRQLHMLRFLGFRNVSVDSIAEDIGSGRKWWIGRAALTFDDGYRNLIDNAVPALEKMRWTATIFVPVAHVGGSNEWDQAQGFPSIALLDWPELDQLARRGFPIGSHGVTHRSFLKLKDDERVTELEQSLARLEKLPGHSRVFCYPFGHFDSRVLKLVKESGYRGGCSLVAGAFPSPSERFNLGRLIVNSESCLALFVRIAAYPLLGFARRVRKTWSN